MLQKIFFYFWVSGLLGAVGLPANAAVFLAPGADAGAFQRHVVQKNQQTYTQWIRSQSEGSPAEAQTAVLDFSRKALAEGLTPRTQKNWSLLRQSLRLTAGDREVLILLAEKLHFHAEICRALLLEPALESLLENPGRLHSNCFQKTAALSSDLRRLLEAGDLLVIDGVVFTVPQIPELLQPGTYHWQILSDREQDREFRGTLTEFSRQSWASRPWVQGRCQDYKTEAIPFSLLLQSQIYFSDDCVVAAIPPEKNLKTWAQEHKTLLWGIGILAAGAAASQLRDKTLVITRP